MGAGRSPSAASSWQASSSSPSQARARSCLAQRRERSGASSTPWARAMISPSPARWSRSPQGPLDSATTTRSPSPSKTALRRATRRSSTPPTIGPACHVSLTRTDSSQGRDSRSDRLSGHDGGCGCRAPSAQLRQPFRAERRSWFRSGTGPGRRSMTRSRLADFDFWTARPRQGASGVGPNREPGGQLGSS